MNGAFKISSRSLRQGDDSRSLPLPPRTHRYSYLTQPIKRNSESQQSKWESRISFLSPCTLLSPESSARSETYWGKMFPVMPRRVRVLISIRLWAWCRRRLKRIDNKSLIRKLSLGTAWYWDRSCRRSGRLKVTDFSLYTPLSTSSVQGLWPGSPKRAPALLATGHSSREEWFNFYRFLYIKRMRFYRCLCGSVG